MMRPSREFMIQQAVLNAAAFMFPWSAANGRLASRLRDTYGDLDASDLNYAMIAKLAKEEFRKIEDRYV